MYDVRIEVVVGFGGVRGGAGVAGVDVVELHGFCDKCFFFAAMEYQEMDERAAWRDFYDNVRPLVWAGLSRLERITISVAERDFHGKRKDRKGNAIRLGAKRVEGLLNRFAPGRYVVERRVVFRRL